jgi:glycosyltransferase involved in cell wall biosynthesis
MVTDDGPQFSVVIPTFNGEERLPRLFAALDRQWYRAFETIVIDDGSTDDTRALLASCERSEFRSESQANAGQWAARNRGATLASGDWLVFVDDDDDVVPQWLGDFAHHATEGVGLVSCGVVVVDESGTEIRRWVPRPLGPMFGSRAALFFPGSFATRRAVFEQAGGYDVEVTFGENFELGIRILETCDRLGLYTVATPNANVRRFTPPPNERISTNPRLQLRAAERVLAKHADRLRHDRGHWANLLAIAGVNAGRLGDWRQARRYLLRAALLHPLRPKPWLRAAAACCPPLGRRIWRQQTTTAES